MKKQIKITYKLVLACCLFSFCQFNSLFAQCVDNSNYWEESWVSCTTSPNPNTSRGDSHWLLFEFLDPQSISTSKIWNANRTGESGTGAKEVIVDVSVDGTTWEQVGTAPFTWTQGTEAIDYDGFEGPDFSSFGFIQKILFTVVSNHDNSNCVSISEVQFDINPLACYGMEDVCGVCDGPGLITWYEDADGDGLGNPKSTEEDCDQPIGFVSNANDPCDNGLSGWAEMYSLFDESGCTGCHGNGGLSGLDLTTYESFSQGGNICGSNILTGNTLVDIITVNNYNGCTSPIPFPNMNERVGGALDANEIALIQAWIDTGAPEDCYCPPGSPDTDNDGICDASDNCPDMDDSLIGTPCDDGIPCTINDVYLSTCHCEGQPTPDSDFDGVCDTYDLAPLNPCTADGTIGAPEPADWVISQSNDCDQDGIYVNEGDLDDFNSCIDDEGISNHPECLCPGSAIQSGGKYHASEGIWGTSAYYAQGLPDGNLSGDINWRDYLELTFPYMEIGQQICFDVGFNDPVMGVQFELNELGTYKFYNTDTSKVNFEIQQFCFDVFSPGEQLIRITRLGDGSVKVDGSTFDHCSCSVGDPQYEFTACKCPTDFSSGIGTLVESAGFNNPQNADGAPDGIFTSWINGSTDSLILTFPEVAVNTEICVVIGMENVAAKVGFDLNGHYFQIANPSGSIDKNDGQEFCFLTQIEGIQTLKIKEEGSGSLYVDGSFYQSCNACASDEDNDSVCDEADICPGFDDLADIDSDGTPDGCDDCNNNLTGTPCDDGIACTLDDTYNELCECVGNLIDENNDGICDNDAISPFIHVDQFGYHKDAEKVAVLSNPQVGFNSSETYTPSNTIELRRTSDDAVVFSGSATAWNGGATHVQSGDQGWWFDFSSYTTEGEFYVFDAANNQKSAEFIISCNPYDEVLTAALRMFYYNRSNIEKTAAHAGDKWTDGVSFMGDTQDGNARYINDPNNAALERDLSGGWFDAGDFNKYVTFAFRPVDQLLHAYTDNPQAFADDTNIPESGNGIPDILDEVKWELDFLMKMTNEDGSTIIKMGNKDYGINDQSPPSGNTATRYYGPTCSSASAALAANLSHAAVVMRKIPSYKEYALTLQEKAENAFAYILPMINNGTLEINCDDQSIKSGDADWSAEEQIEAAIVAAIYLFELTNDPIYQNFLTTYIPNAEPVSTNWWASYKMPNNSALLHYTTLGNADAALVNTILTSVGNSVSWNDFYTFNPNDLYRAYMPDFTYHWGSNMQKANFAVLSSMVRDYNIDPTKEADFLLKLKEQVHYFHGVNPLGMVYLTNMYDYGAEYSANEMYHNWFSDGTIYDHALLSSSGPAPGYVTGGPNASFTVATIAPPAGQPLQKSYLDFNTGYPDASWEVTEPAIYYQAGYIRMLSNAMGKEDLTCAPCPTIGQSCDDGFACTINDTYDENCNCVGEFEDTDYDGICDAEDQCPNEDDLIDVNENGIPDACDFNSTHATCDFNNTPFATPVVGDVSTNDWDREINDITTYTLIGTNGGIPTADGSIVLSTNGTYIFTPTSNFSGAVSFQYEVCDNGTPMACDNAEVFIKVLPAVSPEGNPIIANFDANMVKMNNLGIGNVLANDFDPDDLMLIVTTVLNDVTVSGIDEDGNTVADAGSLTLLDDGSYTFIPTGNFTGKIIQSYSISNNSTTPQTDQSILEITVVQNSFNTTFANDDAEITDKGIQVNNNILQNDNDAEDNAQTVVEFSFDTDGDGATESKGSMGASTVIGGNDQLGNYISNAGTLLLNPDGTYAFTPSSDFVGNITLTYTICDNAPVPACDEATLNFTVLNALRDYGDYSDVYPEAWHRALTDNNQDDILDGTTDVWLGYSTTVETSMRMENEDDAITFGSNPGQFPASPMPDTDYDIDITVNSSSPDLVYYGLWIDWDADGTYDDFYSGSQNTASPATATTTITTPATIGSEVNIRLRADDDPLASTDYQGGKTNGEVEDYRPATVLPVELVSFKGIINQCFVNLIWEVANEENFSHYEIERSKDGLSFSKIGTVNPTNTTSNKFYAFEDKAIEEENYYRLKMVDLDGSFEYSNAIHLTSDCSVSHLKLFPNPASISNGILHVNLQSRSEEVELKIIDLLGRTLKVVSLEVEVDIMNTITLDVSDLSEGTYSLSVDDSRLSKMFILVE